MLRFVGTFLLATILALWWNMPHSKVCIFLHCVPDYQMVTREDPVLVKPIWKIPIGHTTQYPWLCHRSDTIGKQIRDDETILGCSCIPADKDNSTRCGCTSTRSHAPYSLCLTCLNIHDTLSSSDLVCNECT